ncbi:MAG: SRPBCC family protein [Planktothrix sp. GU0601_MAG3]|nr:MAG: SRPBCC family protein [Planktothrix sp. GU0601_MAG3]
MSFNSTPHKSNPVLTTFVSVLGLGITLLNNPLAIGEMVNPNLIASQPQGATVTGKDGQYIAKIVVNSSADTTWKVLTDYNNFFRFLPNVISSKVLKTEGNKKTFEQIYQVQALIFKQQTRVRIASTETYPKQIDFKLVDGDLKSLQGSWKIEPISAQQVLIEHQVKVDPGSTPSLPLFYGIYENSLKQTLEAIKKETENRN